MRSPISLLWIGSLVLFVGGCEFQSTKSSTESEGPSPQEEWGELAEMPSSFDFFDDEEFNSDRSRTGSCDPNARPFGNGNPAVQDIHLVCDPVHFSNLRLRPTSRFHQTSSIDFAGLNFSPIESFRGSYNGQSYELRNISVINPSLSSLGTGIFRVVQDATLANMRFVNASLWSDSGMPTWESRIGVVAGILDRSRMWNVDVQSNANIRSLRASVPGRRPECGSIGGVVGYVRDSIINLNDGSWSTQVTIFGHAQINDVGGAIGSLDLGNVIEGGVGIANVIGATRLWLEDVTNVGRLGGFAGTVGSFSRSQSGRLPNHGFLWRVRLQTEVQIRYRQHQDITDPAIGGFAGAVETYEHATIPRVTHRIHLYRVSVAGTIFGDLGQPLIVGESRAAGFTPQIRVDRGSTADQGEVLLAYCFSRVSIDLRSGYSVPHQNILAARVAGFVDQALGAVLWGGFSESAYLTVSGFPSSSSVVPFARSLSNPAMNNLPPPTTNTCLSTFVNRQMPVPFSGNPVLGHCHIQGKTIAELRDSVTYSSAGWDLVDAVQMTNGWVPLIR